MAGLNWKLEDDYETVTVTFPSDPPVALRLNAAAVDDLLKNLGHFRWLMKPQVAQQFAPGQTVEAVPDPAWVTEPDLMAGDSLFHVRDPRYGWLHYLIPREEARSLVGFLQKQVRTPPPGQPNGKPN